MLRTNYVVVDGLSGLSDCVIHQSTCLDAAKSAMNSRRMYLKVRYSFGGRFYALNVILFKRVYLFGRLVYEKDMRL